MSYFMTTYTFNYLEQQSDKICSPVCLSNSRLETKLFTNKLPIYFNESECKLFMELLKHCIDDDFIFWPLKLNFENFKTRLSNMHPSIKFTFEKSEIIYENEKKVKVLNFLEENSVETDIYYKPTNTHDYLPYNSAHLDHTKNNIHYNLAKRITVFVSNPEIVIICLDELRQFLKECKHREHVISKSIFNGKLQCPAPNRERSKNAIPSVTTY